MEQVTRILCFMASVIIGAACSGGLFAQPVKSPVVGDRGAGIPDYSAPPQKIPAMPAVSGGLQAGETFHECDVCPQMVVIQAGRFEMGSDDHGAREKPRHAVTIPRAFAMGIYEITVGEWDACLREGECRQSPEQGREGMLPIANVSWDDALDYVKWLSQKTGRKYRLPTEAEWEYAARAGTATRYWWGDEVGSKRANCDDCGSPWDGKETSPAGTFEPNLFGLYDVHGNVWEWTQDCWNPSYQGAPGDGGPWMRGDCLSRVLRGGSWALDHEYMRSSRRNRYDRDVRYYLNGFRVVRELPIPAPPGLPSFEAAVSAAVTKVFSNAPKPASGAVRQSFAIDPLIDGLSGAESAATHAMESRMVELIRTDYPQFDVREFSASGASGASYVVIGTFTGVNKQRKTSGVREAFRICLALLDLDSGKVASKAKVFSQAAGIDITPTKFFQDSPAWLADPSTQAYIKTCQATKPGDPIDPLYLDRIRAATLINAAIDTYEKGQYKKSQDLFKRASQSSGGKQLRTYNGLYLTSWKLGERNQAAAAFGNIVGYGLNNRRFGVKFPLRPGSTDFLNNGNDGGQHNMWLVQIAKETARREDCLEIVGHTHQVEQETRNQSLSLQQAEYIKRRLGAEVPELSTRMLATGRGAEENLIGSGTGNAWDALDRRIEFDAIECPPSE